MDNLDNQNMCCDLFNCHQAAEHFSSARSDSVVDSLDAQNEVVDTLRNNAHKWIKSVAPSRQKPSDKDVGETLERLFSLSANNRTDADYKGIELKGKGSKCGTADTLFCMVQNRRGSPVSTIRELILKYGYPSRKIEGNTDLFCDVNTSPNPQGLYLNVSYKKSQVEMHFQARDDDTLQGHLVAIWPFDDLRRRLLEKHPTTAWVTADWSRIDNELHFNFTELEISSSPSFDDFLACIDLNLIVYCVRGGQPVIKGEGKNVDYGHAFRLKNSSDRPMLFREVKKFDLLSSGASAPASSVVSFNNLSNQGVEDA
jgi:hypothetical protein